MDLSTDNHRSAGTDIVIFGNDLLSGRFRKKNYDGIDCLLYEPYDAQARTAIVTTAYAARKRLVDADRQNWSLAILVPTKKMTRLVSDTFHAPPAGMTEIPHVAATEFEAAILAAETIAFLMQPDADGRHFEQFIALMRNYFHGKGSDIPSQADLKEAESLQKAYDEWLARQAAGKRIKKNSILAGCRKSPRNGLDRSIPAYYHAPNTAEGSMPAGHDEQTHHMFRVTCRAEQRVPADHPVS